MFIWRVALRCAQEKPEFDFLSWNWIVQMFPVFCQIIGFIDPTGSPLGALWQFLVCGALTAITKLVWICHDCIVEGIMYGSSSLPGSAGHVLLRKCLNEDQFRRCPWTSSELVPWSGPARPRWIWVARAGRGVWSALAGSLQINCDENFQWETTVSCNHGPPNV